MTAIIQCWTCDGTGKGEQRMAYRFNQAVEVAARQIACPECEGTGELDLEDMNDDAVINEFRGHHSYTDDLILAQTIDHLKLEAFTEEARAFMAKRYRSNAAMSERIKRSNAALRASKGAQS